MFIKRGTEVSQRLATDVVAFRIVEDNQSLIFANYSGNAYLRELDQDHNKRLSGDVDAL